MADNKSTVNEDELRAKIEAEVRAEVEAEAQIKSDAEAKIRKELEEKLKAKESNLEKQIRDQEKTLKAQLDAMPKVTIEIPFDENNPDDIVPVGWNGIIYAIPRGIQFEVPEPIYNIWKESHKKTQIVNKRIRESVNKEIKII